MERHFSTDLILGSKMRLRGQGFSEKALPENSFFPIVDAKSVKAANASDANAELCEEGTLDPSKVKGKIVVCLRGDIGRIEKGITVVFAGGVGMVLANPEGFGNKTFSDPHYLPAVHIDYKEGLAIYSYLKSTTSPVASITSPTTELGIKPAPMMAKFSSRGPNSVTPEILKPDITAPGVDVLAAYTEAKGPTARTRDNAQQTILDESKLKATPFSYGAGQIRPTRAMDPGLVYDLTADDYLSFLCALGYNETQIKFFVDDPYPCTKPVSTLNLNYPSITVPNLNGPVTVTRTVKNVGAPATYTARIVNPPGISVHVNPKTLTFANAGEEKTFTITMSANRVGVAKNYVFGTLIWFDGKHSGRSKIVVKALGG